MSSNSSLTGFSGGERHHIGSLTSNFDEATAPSLQPSSAPDEQLTTQPSTTGSLADAGRRVSEVIGATSSAEASRQLMKLSFPPDLQDPMLSARRYRIVKKLGEGAFGKVFLAWNERRQQLAALKTQHKQRSENLLEVYNVDFLRREMAALKELHHENIVEWFHTIETTTDLYVVLEFCGGGTLFEYIWKKKGLLEDEAKVVFVQILSALHYMHSKTYSHRDLKCANVLIINTDPQLQVKLADFGCSRCTYGPYRVTSYRRTYHIYSSMACGTFEFGSPELVNGIQYNPLLNDLWSLGVVLYQMLFLRLPFPSSDRKEIFTMQKNGVIFPPDESAQHEHLSGALYDLLIGMLQFNIEERFVMRDVLLHYWTARDFAIYETGRLGLSNGVFRLPSEELTVLPYRLSLQQCNDLNFYHNLHHIHQRKYANASIAQVHEIGKTDPETMESAFCTGLKLTDENRTARAEINWSALYANTPDFGAKDDVLKVIDDLREVQNLRTFCRTPAVQDAMSLLHAVLIYYNAGLCSDVQWDEICQEACVKLHVTIQSLESLIKDIKEVQQQLSTQLIMISVVSDMQNDVAKITTIIPAQKDLLYKLDAIAELRSRGFVEQNLRKFSIATRHFGLIDLNGELIECTSVGRPIANLQDLHNCSVQLATQPPRSRNDVRTVIGNLLRRSVNADAETTDAAGREQAAMSKINRILQEPEDENEPNISSECRKRLRELAEIEAEALKAYLK